MPPRSYAMQQLMRQALVNPAPTSIGPVTDFEIGATQTDPFGRTFPTPSFEQRQAPQQTPEAPSNPIADLARAATQTPAEPPMQTGSFRRVPQPIFDSYSEGMEGMAGMPGSGSSDMIPAYNAQNVVEQSNPFMQLRGTDQYLLTA